MNYFHYQDNELYCEQVPVQKIVKQVGTPAYIYSHETLQRHFQAFESALSPIKHLLCYAVKTNSNIAILNLLAKWGAGMDIVSGGELYRALQAGTPPNKIVYAGVGKTADEIALALQSGILMFNVESRAELNLIDKIAGDLGRKAPVALRINPDVDPLTHPYISTGLKKNKFGISFKQALDEYLAAALLLHLEIIGIHKHIGSQITTVGPYMESVNKIVELVQRLRQNGIDIRYLNLGGGLGITYNEEKPPSPQQLAETLIPLLSPLSNCTVIMEPGRSIAGNSGILVTKVLYCKQGEEKNFTIVDAGMNDLVRPSLYNAYHHIQPLQIKERGEWLTDVVGPICESGDFLAKDRKLAKLEAGELLAVMSAGSYGFSMSSNYNSRPRAVEVLVKGDKFQVIRRRESYNDLIMGEMILNL
ncbi:MAG: diaminopimelate decarboxylase [Candidatus Schekmanbacteria bacterium]|nr:diaminopimelate decarboxylase [Candidatus Schekmanbacteria bacterium]